MPIYDFKAIIPKILICKKCKHPVEKGFAEFYSCKKCNAWVKDVKWQEQRIV